MPLTQGRVCPVIGLMSQAPIITEILSRVDSLAKARSDLSHTKLSKRLFGSGHALQDFRTGERSPTLRVIQRALNQLDEIENEDGERGAA